MIEKVERVAAPTGMASLPPDPAVRRMPVATTLITTGTTRPRPYGVLIIGSWTGYSTPALSVTISTFLLMSIAYCLVVPGRPRSYAKAATAVIVTMFCLARPYLAVDHKLYTKGHVRADRWYKIWRTILYGSHVFPGGCVTYRFVFAAGASPVLATTVNSAVAFMPRSELVGYAQRTENLALCGRGATCPG